jgi:hypothetical protein
MDLYQSYFLLYHPSYIIILPYTIARTTDEILMVRLLELEYERMIRILIILAILSKFPHRIR